MEASFGLAHRPHARLNDLDSMTRLLLAVPSKLLKVSPPGVHGLAGARGSFSFASRLLLSALKLKVPPSTTAPV
jgi:hypothetical protein